MADVKRRIAGIRMGGNRPDGQKAPAYTPPSPERDEEPVFRVSDKFGGGGTKFRSMRTERVKSMLKQMEEDPRFINAAIVMLGCFFLLLLFPFYPLWLLPLPMLVVGAIAFRSAPFGTITSLIVAFPAVAYQSPLFAWMFLAALSATMFRAFDTWKLISVLLILVCSPFTAFGFLIIPFHVLAGLLLGSKRGALVTTFTVIAVLILSATWGVQNSGFMVFNKGMFDTYVYPVQGQVFSALAISKAPPAPLAIGNGLKDAFANMFDWGAVVAYLNSAITAVIYTAGLLFLNDSGIVQVVGWTVAVFLVGFIPGHLRSKRKSTIASLSAFIILLTIIVSSVISQSSFNVIAIPSTFLAIGMVWFLERKGIDLSREIDVRNGEMAEKFSKFGLQDLSLARGVERLKDIGGYEKTKKELYDAIVVPLQRKELQSAYGLKPPKGILLFGPPGTGKTLLMRALAREMDIGFYYVKASDMLSQWYGESLPYSERILVMDQNGGVERRPIGEIVEGEQPVRVAAFDEAGRVVFADIKKFIKHRSTSPIFEVRTRSGRSIRVTGYHSLFTLKGGRIEAIQTSELVPGESFIAVPRAIPPPTQPIEHIDFLAALSSEDHRLSVRDGDSYVMEAVKKIGAHDACAIMGFKRRSELSRRLKMRVGFPARGFSALMKAAGVDFDAEKLRICAHKASMAAKVKMDEGLATFIGLWAAEGSFNRRWAVRISTSTEELDGLLPLCERFGSATVHRKGGAADITISSRPLYVFMHHILGLEDGAKRKKLPKFALSLDDTMLAALLRGYFSGDGSIYQNQHGVGTVECSTVSPLLADDLQYALLRFGIVARLQKRPAKEKAAESYRLMLGGANNLQRFSTIGFIDERRHSRLAALSKKAGWARSEQIPVDARLRELFGARLPSRAQSGTVGTGILRRTEWLEDEIEPAVVSSDTGIYFDRVEEIRQAADVEFVYDVSVEPCQNFVGGSGGIFAHNTEQNVAELFKIARANAPCVLFFDEIDAVGKKRDSYTADDVAPRMLSVMLSEMDGFKSSKSVIIAGATNVPYELDPALLRPGRLDKIVYMPLPDRSSRKEIFKVHSRALPLSDDLDFDDLADKTERYSGADIANICTEAARQAAKLATAADRVVPVTQNDFLTVLDNVRPSTSLSSLESYDKFKLDYERQVSPEKREKPDKAVKWKDVVGLDDVREALLEALELPLLHADLMKEYNVEPIKGVLLFGPPGCGKTMIVKAAANEMDVAFLSLSGAEMLKMGYEGAMGQIKDTFNRAKEQAPAVIFIDEIDAIAPSRGIAGSSPLGEKIVAQFLAEMDGVKELKNVLSVGATNRPEIMDSAIMRPGRFDKVIFIHPPLVEGRLQILKNNLKHVPLSDNVSLPSLAKKLDGFSGADIVSICQDAKMRLVRGKISGKKGELGMKDFLSIISGRKPSITPTMMKSYMDFLEEHGERR